MASAKSIVAKLDAALKKVNATNRVIYKRVITTSGDSLIGRTSTDYTDTKLVPSPTYERLDKYTSANDTAYKYTVSSAGDSMQVDADYVLLMSPTAMTMDELANPNAMLVFKDVQNKEEVFRITDFNPQSYQGLVVSIAVYIRSTKRS